MVDDAALNRHHTTMIPSRIEQDFSGKEIVDLDDL